MKRTKPLLSNLLLILAVSIIIGSCTEKGTSVAETDAAQTESIDPETQEEKADVQLEELFQAVESCEYDEIRRLIKAGADVNAQILGSPIFWYAWRCNHYAYWYRIRLNDGTEGWSFGAFFDLVRMYIF